jgi:sugar phosphate isomerase/epimerase
MKIGVFTAILSHLPLEEALDQLAALGVESVEIATGGYAGDAHCDLEALLADQAAARAWARAITDRGLTISALSQHSNPLHPDEAEAAAARVLFERTLELAELLEVPVINAFSGCPGGAPGERTPNWVTCAWPDDFRRILDWQWNDRVIPHWIEAAELASRRGVKVAIEPHPGFVVYNVETMLRLRAAAGPVIGVNFDPSHLFWQGIDAVEAIRALAEAGAIHHVHAKDTYIDTARRRRIGVLDTTSPEFPERRAWMFRTVGFGQGEQVWRDIVSELQIGGYDGTVSIEHEDRLLTTDDGLAKAVELLLRIRPVAQPVHGG